MFMDFDIFDTCIGSAILGDCRDGGGEVISGLMVSNIGIIS